MTMKLISTVTVGAGGASSIDFTGIPANGTDLLILCSICNTSGYATDFLKFRLNGDTANNYSYRTFYGNGSSITNDASTATNYAYAGEINSDGSTANTFGNAAIYIPNYAGSSAKSYSSDAVTENNATAAKQWVLAGKWSGTAAITSLSIIASSISQYSTASLYTITKGSGGATVS